MLIRSAMKDKASNADTRRRLAALGEFRSYIDKIGITTGHKPSKIADEINVSQSTLTRAMKDDNANLPNLTTLLKLAERYPFVRTPDFFGPAKTLSKTPTADVEPAQPPASEGWSELVKQWHVTTQAMQLSGYVPGDLVTTDASVAARDGDVVVAQITDAGTVSPMPILRMLREAQGIRILCAHSAIPTPPTPLIVDDQNVIILGAVTALKRKAG